MKYTLSPFFAEKFEHIAAIDCFPYMKEKYSLFWFRRDLRLKDNAALHHAIKSGKRVLCLFIFDTEILDQLERNDDTRVSFIHKQLQKINQQLINLGSRLIVKNGAVLSCFQEFSQEYSMANVYTNKDYEPFAIARDQLISDYLKTQNIGYHEFKDHVIFEKGDVTKKDGLPYTVYTPYMKKWRENFSSELSKEYDVQLQKENFAPLPPMDIPNLESIGFIKSELPIPEYDLSAETLYNYKLLRDFPSKNATSKLGIHLRFGTISIRQAVSIAKSGNDQFLNELIWREFFMQILANFPYVETSCFKKKYESIKWRNNETEFELWCNGQTGYPMVDAGMRELLATGTMHNRVRMVVASFLCKHLLIDWRWGEAWFANHLLDYEQSSNNGNWQWAAGCGCDAAPYFRIFNPYEQARRFDPKQEYIRKWIPEIDTNKYPKAMVEHKFARQRALDTYSKALKEEVEI